MDQKNNEEKEAVYTLPHTHKLIKPLRFDSGDITEIVFSKEIDGATIGDLPIGDMKSMTMKDYYKPIAKMTNRPVDIIMKVKSQDIFKLVEIFNYFLTESQQTGEASK